MALLLCTATASGRRSNDAELIELTAFPNGSGSGSGGGGGLTTAGRGSSTAARQTTDGDRWRDARPVGGDDGDDAAAATAGVLAAIYESLGANLARSHRLTASA